MATNSTIAVPAKNVRSLDTGQYSIDAKPTLPAVPSGDRIVLFTAPHAMRLNTAHLKVPATLGAAATLKMQKNDQGAGTTYTDMTAATTAATAAIVNSSGLLPMDLAAGDTVELLVGGGTLTAGVVEYDIVGRHA